MLFWEASTKKVKLVMDTLEEFCSALGLSIDTIKSNVMCSRMVQREIMLEQNVFNITFKKF